MVLLTSSYSSSALCKPSRSWCGLSYPYLLPFLSRKAWNGISPRATTRSLASLCILMLLCIMVSSSFLPFIYLTHTSIIFSCLGNSRPAPSSRDLQQHHGDDPQFLQRKRRLERRVGFGLAEYLHLLVVRIGRGHKVLSPVPRLRFVDL